MRIEKLAELLIKLRKREEEIKRDANVSVIVGYTAAYALYLHERIEMKWRGLPRDRSVRLEDKKGGPVIYGYTAGGGKGLFWGPRGQAKFLEQPARMLKSVLAKIVQETVKRGGTLRQGLLLAGLRLQRESMMLVPIDTGNLRASAFTMEEPYAP